MDGCTEETVHASLLKAVSQDPRQVQEASQQLQILSTQQSYYRILAHLFPLENVHYDLRLLCLTQLKEFVIRFWVSSRGSSDGGTLSLSSEDRSWFRTQFLTNVMRLPDARLQELLAVCIAKIARSDWPEDWPELLPSLIGELERGGEAVGGLSETQNAPLAVLVQVVKSFASRRLPTHKKLFLNFVSQLMPVLLRACSSAMTAFQSQLEAGVFSSLPVLLDRLRHLGNVFRCCVEFGLRDSAPCAEYLPLARLHLNFVSYVLSKEAPLAAANLCALVERVLVKMTRLLLKCQECLPKSFAPLIGEAVGGLALPWTALAPQSASPSALRSWRLQRNLLNLVHVLFTCPKYRPRLCPASAPPAEAAAAAAARTALREAVAPHLEAVLRHLVLDQLVLSAADEEEWLRECETRAFPQESEQEWRFGIRGCVQSLLLLLCTEFDNEAPACTLAIIQECLLSPDVDDLPRSRRCEAALGVLGHVAAWVAPEVQFDSIATSVLFPALCRPSFPPESPPEHRLHDLLFRRRALWLLGELCGDQLSRHQLLACLLDCLWEYLQPSHETILRLQATRTLSKVLSSLDEFEESCEGIDTLLLKGLPFAFEGVFQLLQCVRECSTKIALVQVLKLCIFNMQYSPTRMTALRQLAPRIVAFWSVSNPSEPLLRVALLELYNELVGALGSDAVALYDFVCSLLEVAVPVDPNDDDTLLEAGLALWSTFLANAQLRDQPDAAKQRLVALFPRTLPHLERCNEVTLDCLHIAESFAVVAGTTFMTANAAPLAAALTDVVESAEPSLADAALVTVESIFKIYPRGEALQMFEALLRHLMRLLVTPEAEDGSVLRATHLCVLARALLAGPAFFEALLVAAVGAEAEASAMAAMASLLRYRVEHWSSQRQRKLMALALAAILSACGAALPEPVASLRALLRTANAMEPLCPPQGPRNAPRLLSTSSCGGEECGRALPAAKRAAFAEEPATVCDLRACLGPAVVRLRAECGADRLEEGMQDATLLEELRRI